jgi:uncharacterized protein (TIGR02588 family)
MATRKRAEAARTPVAEWIAAGLGLALTLTVLGYSLWEGVAGAKGPPVLTVVAGPVVATKGGYVAPIRVRNAGGETAASVEVRGELALAGQPPEERRAMFAYVPAGGEIAGGLVFTRDPREGRLALSVEGYETP